LQETVLVREAVAVVRSEFVNLSDDLLRKSVVHALIDRQVSGVLHHTAGFLATCTGITANQARQLDFRIGPPPELAEQKRELERFLYDRVYRHPRLVAVRTLAQQRLRTMYEGYLCHPDLLPPHFQKRVQLVGLERTAGEYLAGMTDRFCEGLYQKHFAS